MRVGPFIISNAYTCADSFSYSTNILKYYDYSFAITELFIQDIKRK